MKQVTEAKTKKAKKAKAEVIVRRKPSAQTVRRITCGTKKAMDALKAEKAIPAVERDAIAGIKAVAKITGTEQQGSLSPLGHKANCQNGVFDLAILSNTNSAKDFAAWVKAVLQANPASRRSDVDDNNALLKRLSSHFKFISGRKPSGERNFPKRLEKVGLAHKAEEIMNAFVPASVLFDEYMKAGKF